MNTKKNNIPKKSKTNVSNEVVLPDDKVLVNATKVSEKVLECVTETPELVNNPSTEKNLLKHIPSAKAQRTATLSTEEKYAVKQQRYSNNRTARQAKLQAKKDKFIARIIEENKLDASFTKEMAESMWYDKHDSNNRITGEYITKIYDKKDLVWKQIPGDKWSLVALKAKETLATLRNARTVTQTVIGGDGIPYTRKIVLKPVFDKKTNTRSIELAKERFKAHKEQLKVNKENTIKIKKANLFLEIRKKSVDNPDQYYAAQTIPFKGNAKAATKKALKIRDHYKDSKEFASVVVLEYDKQIKALHPLKVIKNAA